MQIFTTIQSAVPKGRAAVACGYFDGLHVGHAAVIRRAVSRAARDGMRPCVFTFTMNGSHPAQKQEGNDILTDSRKYAMLEDWGVRAVLAPDFSEFQEMSPEEFVDNVLVRGLNAGAVCCGHDFRFGRGASGDVALLEALCAARGIGIELVPAVTYGGERVSSTRIRALLGAGDVGGASELLGRAFGYDFTVVEGKRLGRTIDSPTINQRLPAGFVRLRHGVYASAAQADGVWYPSVTNVGVRPTVEDTTAVNSETYLIGYAGDLYGRQVEVRLLDFLREERKFPSVEALRARIQSDAAASEQVALRYIAENCANSAV